MCMKTEYIKTRKKKKYMGTRKTTTRKIAIRTIPTGQFPPAKLPPSKIITQDNSHPE